MSGPSEDTISEALSKVLLEDNSIDGLDEDLVAYISGLLASSDDMSEEAIDELMGPFLDSVACPASTAEEAKQVVLQLATSSKLTPNETTTVRKLKQGIVSMSSDLSGADDETNKYLWGATKAPAANQQIDAYKDKTSARDKRKARQELEKARREFLASQKEQDDNEEAIMKLPDYSTGRNDRDVNVRNVQVSLDNGTVLLDNSELKLAYRRRYGLIGENGVGKSTLLKAMASLDMEGFPRHLRILHVRQELKVNPDKEHSVLELVIESDVERNSLLQEEAALLKKLEQADDNEGSSLKEKREKLLKQSQEGDEFAEDLKRLDQVYARLQLLSSDSAQARAAMILSGLQFTPEMQAGPMSSLSGGWRMRVALASALFIEPDILLLDEPTNHLDLEAVLWLENYLLEYKHTLLVVSHDRGFLNEVCTDIIEFKHKKLTYYRGNFDTYVKLRDENIRNAMRVYQAYQSKRQHMMEFIEKFRANAKRATMVQSRIKAVEKMDLEAPEPVVIDPVWRFHIPTADPVGRPIISVDDVSFDYKASSEGVKKPESEFLLQKVNFGVDLNSRIAILGANGQGKTTLLNLIMGKMQAIKGSVTINPNLRIAHFTQHSSDNFDLQLSATENMLNIFKSDDDLEMRSFLGKFQIQGTDAIKPMFLLSGGQKSRVAFAALAYKKPHVLVIDEGSNHLSMEAVDALVEAVQSFKGGLIVVSHDQYFVSNTCTELWVVSEGKATRFRGDFDSYKKHTAEKTRKRVEESVKRMAALQK